MATHSRLAYFSNHDTTATRNLGAAWRAGLEAVGLVRANDTGQIDWATVNNTGAVYNGEAYLGYEMYRFTDALQATRPVFIKFEWWQPWMYNNYWGIYIPMSPNLFVTVGTSTNGTGTVAGTAGQRTRLSFINGQILYQTAVYPSPKNPSAETPMMFSGDGASLAVALGVTTSAQPVQYPNGNIAVPIPLPVIFCIERTRNPDGTPNGDGVIFLSTRWDVSNQTQPTAPTSTFQVVSFAANSSSAVDPQWPVTWPGPAYGSGATGQDLYVWPVSVSSPKAQNMLSFLGIYRGDVGQATDVNLNVLGAVHRYRSIAGIGGTANGDNTRSHTNTRVPQGALMMRWE